MGVSFECFYNQTKSIKVHVSLGHSYLTWAYGFLTWKYLPGNLFEQPCSPSHPTLDCFCSDPGPPAPPHHLQYPLHPHLQIHQTHPCTSHLCELWPHAVLQEHHQWLPQHLHLDHGSHLDLLVWQEHQYLQVSQDIKTSKEILLGIYMYGFLTCIFSLRTGTRKGTETNS